VRTDATAGKVALLTGARGDQGEPVGVRRRAAHLFVREGREVVLTRSPPMNGAERAPRALRAGGP